jgi:putative peptide zinc metalloprotease protein
MVSPQRITLLYERLEAAKLLSDPDKVETNNRFHKIIRKLISPSFSIPHPDEAITLVYRFTRFLFNPAGFIFLVLVGFSGIYPLLNQYDQLMDTIANLESFFLSHPEAMFVLYFLVLVVALIHEFGHGLMCKHYGGKVNRLGIMFYLGTFIFFCDTSSAWNFPRRSQRFLVSLVGPLTTFAVLGLGLWAAGGYINSGALWEPIWVCLSLVCIVILILNFNPFIRMDAYYMLMDLTNIPNLRTRSLQFIKSKLLGLILPKQKKDEAITPQVKSLFWIYGIVGALVTVIFAVFPFINIARMLVRESSQQGKLFLGFVLITLIVFRLGYQGYQKFRAIRHRTYKLK